MPVTVSGRSCRSGMWWGTEMNKFLQACAAVLLSFGASPAFAVSPATQATATARIYKPLTISFVQNLDFGTLVLAGPGVWAGQVINMDQAGALTGCGGNVTCSGSPQPAKYQPVRTHNAPPTTRPPRLHPTGPRPPPL